jgi:hypothetical protein
VNRAAQTQVAVRKLAKALQGPAAGDPGVPQSVVWLNGVVLTVTAGASTDGRAAVVVTVNGTDTPAPYLLSYASPTVGDVVRVQIVNGSPLIVGEVVGFPAF